MSALREALTAISRASALFGGLLLLVAVGVTCASVVGGLLGKPILGDSEVVELCLGVAIALALPWAEMRGGHVIVDVFTARMPARGVAWLDALMRAAVALVATVLAVQIADGAYGQWDRERASMFLELPYWWGYAGAAVGLALWTVTALFVAAERFGEARRAA
ncbi:TRAP transporter small permease [Roseomonas sp. PWR1]|uniref:TRAP transporter small permease protein n=1 Tax=Roseomonas nitratireducens TaxID=2820810 RepID=A0ABS4AU62_9PROT|nr:TRAP transporter small permease [Neoroseomonas nitratireducens]MBP0464899.1 TRAP transporter small permease [Neoroseomonas nitratireducens]